MRTNSSERPTDHLTILYIKGLCGWKNIYRSAMSLVMDELLNICNSEPDAVAWCRYDTTLKADPDIAGIGVLCRQLTPLFWKGVN